MRLNRLILRWLINAIAIFTAAYFVPGVRVEGGLGTLIVVALIFGLINALIRPVLLVLGCPLVILTLGLFTLVINTALFWLTSVVSQAFSLGFYIDGIGPAFWGALVATLMSVLLTLFVGDDKQRERRKR
jgi:putative membrane protein